MSERNVDVVKSLLDPFQEIDAAKIDWRTPVAAAAGAK
jgi:hypothetical protein